jgi:hypothetical protein
MLLSLKIYEIQLIISAGAKVVKAKKNPSDQWLLWVSNLLYFKG